MYFTILNWSRDWEKFDYMDEYCRLCSGQPTTLTKDTFAEYIRWLSVCHPDMYMIYMLTVLDD